MECSSRAFGRPAYTVARFARCGLRSPRMFSSLLRQPRPSGRAFGHVCAVDPKRRRAALRGAGPQPPLCEECDLLKSDSLDEASVADLADRLGIGPRHLLRLFLRHVGATPSEIAATQRVQAAKRLIDQTAMPLSEIAFAAGFRSIRRFNDAFRATYRRTPSSFRQRAI